MKLKYYLRGLGIGIIVTTILLMIAFALHKPTMSDADIIARAKQLGMVMPEDEEPLQDTETTESTEVTAVPETEAAQIEEQTTEAAANTEEPVTADETENPESEMTDTEVATEVSSEANEENNTAVNAAPYTLVVNSSYVQDNDEAAPLELVRVSEVRLPFRSYVMSLELAHFKLFPC